MSWCSLTTPLLPSLLPDPKFLHHTQLCQKIPGLGTPPSSFMIPALYPSGFSYATFFGKFSLIAHLSRHFHCHVLFLRLKKGAWAAWLPLCVGGKLRPWGGTWGHPVRRQNEEQGRIPDPHQSSSPKPLPNRTPSPPPPSPHPESGAIRPR